MSINCPGFIRKNFLDFGLFAGFLQTAALEWMQNAKDESGG
jgi:hypothetical protein